MSTTDSRTRLRVAAVAAGTVIALGAGAAPGSAAFAADLSASEARVSPRTVAQTKSAIAKVNKNVAAAKVSLASAGSAVRTSKPVKASAALKRLRVQVLRAHVFAQQLLTAQPVDPESDDAPGPPAVGKVLGLDHLIAARLVPLFHAEANARIVSALHSTLSSSQIRRDRLVTKVVALPAEGALDDYADGLADSLGTYTSEVTQLNTAVSTYTLTTEGRATLTAALTRVKDTQAKMEKAFGGGE